MQRQSLGSPVSKLHSNGGGGAKEEIVMVEDPKRTMNSPSSSSNDCYDENHHKASKPNRFSLSSPPPPPPPDKFIHLIPILTLVCFLILFLFSHSPSQSDMTPFRGFKPLSKKIDSAEIGDDIARLIDLKKSDILPIRSLHNLQEFRKQSPKFRPHRKITVF